MHNLFWSLLILFAIATLLRLDWVYYLVYIVGGVWVFSHWWARRSFKHLEVRRQMLHHAFVGERIAVDIHLANRSWLPFPWLMLEDRAPLDLKDASSYRWVLNVGSRARTDQRYNLHAKRRGYYAVGPLQLNTGDLFGFSEAAWQEAQPTYVTIYPQIIPLHELGLPSRSPFGVLPSRQRLFEDPDRLTGVRDYATGDSLRRIHWKASAHEDRLLVKKFQPAIALDVVVVLDLNRTSYPYMTVAGSSEWAIVIAASVASYVTTQRQPIGLITYGVDSVTGATTAPIPPRQGQGHLMTILTALARVQTHEYPQNLAEWLPQQIAALEWGATLIVVTPQLSEQTLWVLQNAYRRGSNVVVLVCAPQPDFDTVRAEAGQLHIAVYRTIWDKDLHSLAQTA